MSEKTKRIKLQFQINEKYKDEVFKSGEDRKKFAAQISLIVSMVDNKDDMPYMHQPEDDYRWSVDRYGNDFWLTFDMEENTSFTLSCRYDFQIEILEALANYISKRTKSLIVGFC